MAGTSRRKPGWMGTYIEGLRAWLLERGYTPGSIKLILTLAGQLGRWMQTADVKFSQLDSAAVASFLDALRARGVRRVPGPRGLRPLLDYLDSEGALAFKPVPDSPVKISQVLRQRDLATTAVYAKVNLDALRGIANRGQEVHDERTISGRQGVPAAASLARPRPRRTPPAAAAASSPSWSRTGSPRCGWPI